MKTSLWAGLLLFLALAATPVHAETPSLRLDAPAWMLREDNPLRTGKPYDGTVTVELPGYRYDPPLEVPAAPSRWPPAPGTVEVAQILAHLQVEAELGGEVLIHATGFHGDAVIVLVAVARRQPARILLPLVQRPAGTWTIDEALRKNPQIDALGAAWDESGWIEVIGTDLRGTGD